MRESCTYGSVGALGGQPPRATRPVTPPLGTCMETGIQDVMREPRPPVFMCIQNRWATLLENATPVGA